MSEVLDPHYLLRQIAGAVPEELKPNLVVVGSVAAAHYFREKITKRAINTKDADVVIQPAGAVLECAELAHRLLARGWTRIDKCRPRGLPEPRDDLDVIRLHPPGSQAFFLEFLAFPERGQIEAKTWVPVKLDDGWYGLPSFRFLGLTMHSTQAPAWGITCAGPPMMALANLLSHPSVGTASISEPLAGRRVLRSAKDLGRVLALARLAEREETEAWVGQWEAALRSRFPVDCDGLATRVGNGLRAMLQSRAALDDALHAVNQGLLSGLDVTLEQLRVVGEQLIVDAIDPLTRRFSRNA